ncbi:MAG TPA: ATP-binding protein [Gemmatimonadaceae bacterium]|nr:ATP-binding protein [Gemmatimonadaceae bacterium]
MLRAKSFSPGQGLRSVSRGMSLELKLPLLMSLVLAAVLATSVVATLTTLRFNARTGARERMTRAVHEIVTVGATNLAATGARFRGVGQDSAIQRALDAAAANDPRMQRAVDMRRVRERLTTLSLPTDSGMPIELWTADGERVTYVGDDIRPKLGLDTRPELPAEITTSAASRADGDSVRFSALYAVGSRVHFWNVSPIIRNGRTVGYITKQGRLAVGATTQRTLRMLSGDSVSIFYRNVDGRFWAGGTGGPSQPILDHVDGAGGTARLASGEPVIFHEERFAETPVMVGMFMPSRTLYVRAERNVRALSILGAFLLIAGTIAAWLVGRNLARPLTELTRAAGALAAGDFATRVPEGRDLEIRRLAESFNHMASELGASRSALERRTTEAQQANRAKSEFLTTMSHELRTPLNAIGGYVELMEMGLRGPLTEEQQRDLARIKASQEHLLGLISGVLDLSRIEAGRLSYNSTNVPVAGFLRGVDALIGPQAAAKSVALEHVPCDDELAVVADREKLRQIVLNLLSNAIRHTPAGGTVTLSGESRGSRVAVMVEDTGPGIPHDKRDVIFEPFVQLDRSLTQMREGLGLGLAISRDLARGMSGDLVVEERLGGGARFVVLLPRGELTDDDLREHSGEIRAARR